MNCTPSNLELESVVTRIQKKYINLQPDYQRGEVWTDAKKKKLIDTIIRGWMIPPIHVISERNATVEEVLDGQQRLVAIRDFYEGKFRIDGNIHPLCKEVQELDGKTYDELPEKIKFYIDRYTITFIKLSEYLPEEPAELFNRLNQPSPLTAAEKRNSYIGKTRSQVKQLVETFEEMGASKELIGFSNSRLAYDEVVSKFAFLVESNTLKKKVTAGDIAKRYQEDDCFKTNTVENVCSTLTRFIDVMKQVNAQKYRVKMSKATIISWWLYIYKNNSSSIDDHTSVMVGFETARELLKTRQIDICNGKYVSVAVKMQNKYAFFETMLNIYNQRASIGSTDSLAIIYRDIIIHIFADMMNFPHSELLQRVTRGYEKNKNITAVLDYINKEYEWGRMIR